MNAHIVYNVNKVIAIATEEELKARAAKAKRTKAANKKNMELQAEELTKARSSARNARRALKEYKSGMEAGIKLVTDAMRANN